MITIRKACRPWWVDDVEWMHFANYGLVGNLIPTLLDAHIYFIKLYLRGNLFVAILALVVMFVPLIMSTVSTTLVGFFISYFQLQDYSPFKSNYAILLELENDIRNDMITK
jgi:hypothetical protein